MLQQTRVGAIGDRFARFVARFPDPRALAAASEDETLAQWSGLGYYARARNLRRAAQKSSPNTAARFRARAKTFSPCPASAQARPPPSAFSLSGERRRFWTAMSSAFWRVFLAIAPSSIAPTASRVCGDSPQVARRAPTTSAPTRKALWIWGRRCAGRKIRYAKNARWRICAAPKKTARNLRCRENPPKSRAHKKQSASPLVARADRIGFSILPAKTPRARNLGRAVVAARNRARAESDFRPRAAAFAGETQSGGNRIARRSAGARFARDRARVHSFSARFVAGFVFRRRRRKRGLLWLPRGGIDSAPLSAPVARLLRGLDSHPALRRNQSESGESGKRVKKSGATRVAGPKIDSSK